ncbi:helix-turn-helix transcriptional regulator [Roseibium porphyridii]|uniref:Helix-turn-helix transcriptional regulator n=1 Tax=Roseibium porphyridii TaxID=2866279 RepID=A0ABY8F7Y1_9HYPH|nr:MULTISPECIES: helix-turn-helix transcriptional regulator [Stappiaceae]QFT29945.1 Transcriptional regulatory protein LiaR [Labrenzia sp. THAF82]WFE90624.1 helix-turn-helix transcriptional regulator [Roseibium sp. KMA01]
MTAHFALNSSAATGTDNRLVASNIRWPLNLSEMVTPRQLEIMLKLCEGKVNKQIAWELDVTTATVKAHIRNAITRLGAKNRVNAVAIVAANSASFRHAAV